MVLRPPRPAPIPAATPSVGLIDASRGGEPDHERRRKIETTLDDVRRAKPGAEKLLCHFTSRDVCEKICAGGFLSSVWGLEGEGVYLSDLSPVGPVDGAQWPQPAFREAMLKANYGAAWADANRRCAVDCVLVCCVDGMLLTPVAGRTGAWKVDTQAVDRVGGDATLKRCIKKAFVLYDSTQLPDAPAAAAASSSA